MLEEDGTLHKDTNYQSSKNLLRKKVRKNWQKHVLLVCALFKMGAYLIKSWASLWCTGTARSECQEGAQGGDALKRNLNVLTLQLSKNVKSNIHQNDA